MWTSQATNRAELRRRQYDVSYDRWAIVQPVGLGGCFPIVLRDSVGEAMTRCSSQFTRGARQGGGSRKSNNKQRQTRTPGEGGRGTRAVAQIGTSRHTLAHSAFRAVPEDIAKNRWLRSSMASRCFDEAGRRDALPRRRTLVDPLALFRKRCFLASGGMPGQASAAVI